MGDRTEAWRFGVLGPLLFERAGVVVPVPSGRQRSLLGLLLRARGVPLSRDRLVDELWGERPPASAVSALHVHLSKLRGLLGELLVLQSGGYSLRPGGYELDVDRFGALVEEAASDRPNAARLLRDALELFRGEPLCDVEAEGSIAHWRRELDDRRVAVTTQRIDADLSAGIAAELVPELERLVTEHPYEERLWGQLMLALYRSGRQADALESFQRARRGLATEVGLEPGDVLVGLQKRMLEHDPELLLRDRPQAPPANRKVSSLPAPLTRLIGREHELPELARLMVDPDVRIVTLTGPGGVGKTRLLLELARQQEPWYSDGAVFVALERLTDPALVAAEIATALARRDGAEGLSADGLGSYLHERELLLVLDNFEHLLGAGVLVTELLALAPRLRALVSSRTPLHIRGEHLFEVQPLAVPAENDDPDAQESPAVQLFLQRALAANRDLQIDGALTSAVVHICRALDGLPLAIELAASRAQALSPGQIASQLARPLLIGERALRDLPDRQQTLQSTIRWSFDLLSEGAQDLLLRAGVFLGGFTLPALEAVAGRTATSGLDELLDASLVRRRPDVDRFTLLELVRAFASAELDRSGLAPQARQRHRAYFAELAAPVSEHFDRKGEVGEASGWLVAEHPNLRGALENAIDAHDPESASAVGLALRALWVRGMLRQEAHEFITRLLDTFDVPVRVEMALLRTASFLDRSDAGLARSEGFARRLGSRAAALGDHEALVIARCSLFADAMNAHDIEELRRMTPGLRELIGPDTDTAGLGWIHYALATAAYIAGDLKQACDHAASSVASAELAEHQYLLASAAMIALLAQSARDGVIAREALARHVELARRVGAPPACVSALWLLARYAASVAPEEAGRWLAHAERIFGELDDDLWPESSLRDEALAVLGIDDLGPLLAATTVLGRDAALVAAVDWLGSREPGECAARDVVAPAIASPDL